MLFLTYWKVNENMPMEERLQIARDLTQSGAFPPDNVEIVRWDSTPDGWGILLAEAESAADVNRAVNLWRMHGKGFFEMTKTAPAQPAREAIESLTALLENAKAPQPAGSV